MSARVRPGPLRAVLAGAVLVGGLFGAGRAGASAPSGMTPIDGVCPVEPAPEQCRIEEGHRLPEGREATRIRRQARALRAPGGIVEDPCVDPGSGCEPALLAAARSFDRARSGGRAGVVIFGNSLIAADRIVNVLRRRLQEQLGDGGRGFVLADRLGDVGPRDRTADDAEGWVPGTVADVEPRPALKGAAMGFGGAVHVSEGPARSRFQLDGETEATVFGIGGRPAPLELRVDAGRWHPVVPVGADQGGPTTADTAAILHRFLLPPGARRVELRALRAGAAVHGVVLEHGRGGVVVDTLGVAAADARRFMAIDEAVFRRQLDARAPDLVVLMLGGNETKRMAWGHESTDAVETHLRALIRRIGPGPDRSCLVVGPIDAVVGTRDLEEGADPLRQRPELLPMNALHRHVALNEGCAYFDLYTAMGGEGSLRRLHEAGALHDDLVHPKELGLSVLGQLLADALLQAWPTASDPAGDSPLEAAATSRPRPFVVTTTLDEDRADNAGAGEWMNESKTRASQDRLELHRVAGPTTPKQSPL